MLIVTQNQDAIFNLDTLETIAIMFDNSIAKVIADDYWTLAKYSTEEKAKMALRDVWSAYANNERVYILPEE